MRASNFEFRFRFLIHAAIYILGFWAPWDRWLHLDGRGPNAHLWGTASALLAKAGVGSIGTDFDGLLVAGIVLATLAALLRTWGAAYLGAGVVKSAGMHGEQVVSDGPYRHVRNPLYLGIWVHTLALALLMPVTGAIFCVAAIAVFELRLILAEERFLEGELGEPYREYCAKVPRLWPSLRARVPASGAREMWGWALLGEIYFWGVAGSFAFAGWRYNATLLSQCVLVSLGVSMVARGFVPTGNRD